MEKKGFSAIRNIANSTLFAVLNPLLVFLVILSIFHLDLRTYQSWFFCLVPFALSVFWVKLSQNYKKSNTRVTFHLKMAFFYLLCGLLLTLSSCVFCKLLLFLLLLFYSLEFRGVLAPKDELTGLFNQRFFHHKLKKVLKKARKYHKVGLILIEPKKYRDFMENWGSFAASILLKNMAKALGDIVNKDEYLVHYGGGRFAVITRGRMFSQIIGRAEKLRRALAVNLQKSLEEEWNLPLAVGLSIYPDQAAYSHSLVQKADKALQRAVYLRGSRAQTYYSIFNRMSGKMNREFMRAVNVIMARMQARDSVLYGHSERVLIYSQLICRALRLSPKRAMCIEFAAFLHDIGKVEWRRDGWPGQKQLEQAGAEAYRQHPVLGAEMLQGIMHMQGIIPSIIYHHERYDASGYPYGLKGAEIPLGARIIAVADYFDYLTSEGPYGKGKSISEGIRSLSQHKTTYFDPLIVDAFVKVIHKYEDLSHLMEWPKGLSKIVPAGYTPNNYLLGGHYADYYFGKLHFTIKVMHCIAAGIANNEKCLYIMDPQKEQYFLQQFKNFIFQGLETGKKNKPGQLEGVSLPDYVFNMPKKRAKLAFETKKMLKALLENADKEQFNSVRLIIDHAFLNFSGEEFNVWERTLTQCIKNQAIVVVCYYDVETIAGQVDIIEALHDMPISTTTDLLKEDQNSIYIQ